MIAKHTERHTQTDAHSDSKERHTEDKIPETFSAISQSPEGILEHYLKTRDVSNTRKQTNQYK